MIEFCIMEIYWKSTTSKQTLKWNALNGVFFDQCSSQMKYQCKNSTTPSRICSFQVVPCTSINTEIFTCKWDGKNILYYSLNKIKGLRFTLFRGIIEFLSLSTSLCKKPPRIEIAQVLIQKTLRIQLISVLIINASNA